MTAATVGFDPAEAFSRNLGLVNERENLRLRDACVALPGLGGVGGAHLEVLARQGIGRFILADPDRYETANLNRQFGATVETLGRSKVEVSAERVRAINPAAEVRVMPEALHAGNMASFLTGADIVVDGLDAFAIEARRALYREARRRGIPVVAAGPFGFGCTILVFDPNGMTFDDYYDLKDVQSPEEQFARFVVGTSPRALHAEYLDVSYVDVSRQRAPSSSVGVAMAAAAAATEVLRWLLGWPGRRAAPAYAQYDLRRRRWIEGRLWGGNRHPLQRLKRAFLVRRLRAYAR